MSYLRVSRPEPTRGPFALEVVAILLLVVAGTLLAANSFSRVPIVADGRSVDVAYGTTLAALAADGVLDAMPGDLLAAGDQSVIRKGAGGRPRFVVDGALASPNMRITAPVDVHAAPGEDVVEDVLHETVPVPIPIDYRGEGSFEQVVEQGSAGVRRISIGVASGQVVDDVVIEEPVPSVVRRRPLTPSDLVVALTFDDGPWPGQTEKILDILADEDVTASFLMIGSQAERFPALARRVAEEGHVIGNHTQSHKLLGRAEPSLVRQEIAVAQTVLKRVTGVRPRWFRAPGGFTSVDVYAACEENRLYLIGWTVDPQDWNGHSSDALAEDVLTHVRPGSVVLLHDGGGSRSATLEALPTIIAELKKRGYRFVTLDEVPALAWQ